MMSTDTAHARAPLRPPDPQSSPPSQRTQSHKRQRSQTLGTTFVSTAVVPAPSNTDVLSSLITSLTLLSDTAREQIRSARELELEAPFSERSLEISYPESSTSFDANNEVNNSIEYNSAIDVSDGDEAEPPVVGYSRSRHKGQKRPSIRERWIGQGSNKDRSTNMVRSASNQTFRRPPSGASSGIGIPSIERGHSGSSSSLLVSSSAGTKSPLAMFFPSRQDDELNHTAFTSTRDMETKSIRTVRSKQSTRVSQEQEKENHVPTSATPVEEQSSPQHIGKFTPDHKTYSPLSPSNREDLSEHLIPSRRSSIRHSLSIRESSKGRSPSAGRCSSIHSKSFSMVGQEMPPPACDEEPFEEEDSTLRRIRELQQAKEKRHSEWRKESKRPDRLLRRTSRKRSKSREDLSLRKESSAAAENPAMSEYESLTSLKQLNKSTTQIILGPSIHEIEIPSPSLNGTQAMPSPVPSTPRKHKRSLSAGLRRSLSSKHRPTDEIQTVSEQVEAFLTAPRLTQRIRHPRTGRTIAFSEVGDPNGFAVFCCVGMGLTRYVTSFYDDVARTQKLRLITPDRPGIGESSPFPDNVCTPLSWVDDVAVICQTLNIDKFSLLAHSAGSIYALATALKMPDRVRGRIHLLAPWIPPSQFPNGAANHEIKVANLPIAHKLLSILPAPLLKAANSRFLSATSASIETRGNKNSKKDRSMSNAYDTLLAEMSADIQPVGLSVMAAPPARHSSLSQYARTLTATPPPYHFNNGVYSPSVSPSPTNMKRQYSSSAMKLRSPTPNDGPVYMTPQARQALLNSEITHRTWALATLNANPAVDLLVCLERRRPIGFRYTDVVRNVVIHHGRNDARVPLENVQWLSTVMKHCELRILNDEGHGLMASANVMSRVLSEIGREWEEWDKIAKDDAEKLRDQELEIERLKEVERRRYI